MKNIFIFLLLLPLYCLAAEPPKIGNFSLPSSQAPGPLIGFGQNIVDKNQWELVFDADDFVGVNKHSIDLIPAVIYGFTSNFSLFVAAPYAASYQSGNEKSNGLEDAIIQLEYAFYNGNTATYNDLATFVTNITLPTGSIQKNPNTGAGSPAFFLGATFNRSYVDWFFFGSPGVVLTTANNGSKEGNSYFYQAGFGRSFFAKNGWILAWMLEFDGTYQQKSRINGVLDPDSGGNVVYGLPSLWASTKHLILEFGVGPAVTQRLFGNQTRDNYAAVFEIRWSIYGDN